MKRSDERGEDLTLPVECENAEGTAVSGSQTGQSPTRVVL